MKSKGVKIVLIIFLGIIVVTLIGTMVFAMVNKDKKYSVSFLGFGDKTKTLLQNEYNINEVKDIEVIAKSTNVKFVEGNSNKVLVTIYGKDGDNARASLNDGKLEINKENNRIYILALFMFVRDEIVVELPRIYDGEVRCTCYKWKCRSTRFRRGKYEYRSFFWQYILWKYEKW